MELSFPEILLILAIAFLVLGPRDMIKAAEKMGRMIGKFKSQMNNMKIMLTEEVLAEDRKKLEAIQQQLTQKIDITTKSEKRPPDQQPGEHG